MQKKRNLLTKLLTMSASFWLLASMLTAPVLASVAINSVTSAAIVDGAILNRDIKANAISSSRIKDSTILNRDIAENVITSSRIRNGTIRNSDIAPDAAISESKIKYPTRKRRLVIPPGALVPEEDTIAYKNSGYIYLKNGGVGAFTAPVYLPDDARITKLLYQAYDLDGGSTRWTQAQLFRLEFDPSEQIAVTPESADTGGWQTLSTASIISPVIDADHYSYYVRVRFWNASAGTLLRAGNVIIEYTVTGP